MTAGPDSSSSSSRNFIATFCPVSLFSASCTKLMLPLRIRPQRLWHQELSSTEQHVVM